MTPQLDFFDKNTRPNGAENAQVVAIYMPRANYADLKPGTEQDSPFKKAFLDTLDGKGRGLLMPYLYHDPQTELVEKSDLLYGSNAWDALVAGSNSSYKTLDDEISALDNAITHQLLGKLPQNIKIIEYGPGGKTGVIKPKKLIRAIVDSTDHVITSYTAVDILNRFATESTLEIHEEFNLQSYAIVGDFTAPQSLSLPNETDSIPLVVSFGGGFANAPDNRSGYGKGAKDNAIECFTQMNKQHGLGSYVLLSYHAESSARKLLRNYRGTSALEAFIMSAFVRAVSEGVILDPSYDPYKNWSIKPSYDASEKSVIEYAVCQKSHTVNTATGPYSFKRGCRIPMTLSHKWDEADYRDIFKAAGYDVIDGKCNASRNSPYGILLAKAVSLPDLS